MPAKRIQLTKFRINKVLRNQHREDLVKNINAFNLEKKNGTKLDSLRNYKLKNLEP